MSHARSGKPNLIFYNIFKLFFIKSINVNVFFWKIEKLPPNLLSYKVNIAFTTGHYAPLTMITKVYEGHIFKEIVITETSIWSRLVDYFSRKNIMPIRAYSHPWSIMVILEIHSWIYPDTDNVSNFTLEFQIFST